MIEVYTLKDHLKWDEIVKSFSSYDVYYLSGYLKAFEIHGDGEPLLFYCESNGTRAINAVMCRDIAKTEHLKGLIPDKTYFDLSTPYGYGGWLIEGEGYDAVFNEYFLWCKSNNIICEFTRFHPLLNNKVFSEKSYEVINLGDTVALDLSSPEEIWANLTSKNRNMIRKAQNSGVEILISNSKAHYDEFQSIYNATMQHDNASPYYYFSPQFYDSVRSDLADHSKLFLATKDDKIIAGSIILFSNQKMHYHLSGSNFEYRNLAPTNLLLYEAALWGCENGLKSFNLGGGVGSQNDNLFKFKKSFYRKDDVCQFSIGKKIFNQDVYEHLVKMRTNITNSNFFPQYRA